MKRNAIWASAVVAAVTLGVIAPLEQASAQNRQTDPALRIGQRCLDRNLIAQSERDLRAAIQAAVRALPQDRSSSEDIEAAIIFAISQRNLCPGVARTVLGTMTDGSPQLLQAVSRVRLSLLDGGTIGTAGLGNAYGGGGTGASFFSAPMAGVGGGAANYSQ